MENSKDKKVELPEILEFLRLSRTVNRQLKLFKGTDMKAENIEIIKNAASKMRKEINDFINDQGEES